MKRVQAKRSLSKCKTTHTGPSLEITIPGRLKFSISLGIGARAKEAGRTQEGQHVAAPVGFRVQEQLWKDDSFSETVEKVCEGCEIIFIATEGMLKNETDEHAAAALTAHVYLSHCIKRAKPLLACLCFVHQVELFPDDFNLLFTFSKARTASKYLQKNNSPFLFLISMRLF